MDNIVEYFVNLVKRKGHTNIYDTKESASHIQSAERSSARPGRSGVQVVTALVQIRSQKCLTFSLLDRTQIQFMFSPHLIYHLLLSTHWERSDSQKSRIIQAMAFRVAAKPELDAY
jgi:hypothetical protein